MEKTSRAARGLYAAAEGTFAAVFTAAVFCAVFDNRISFYTVRPAVLLAFCAMVAAVLVCGWLLWRRAGRLTEKRANALALCGLAVYWPVSLFVAWCLEMTPTPSWDFGIVFSAAMDLARGLPVEETYFAMFPNNIPLCLVLTWFFRFLRLFGLEPTMFPALVLNTLCVSLSLWLLYRLVKTLAGPRCGLFALCVGFATAPFMLYGPIVYTDTLTMPMPVGAACLWAECRKGGAKKRLAGLLGAAALCALGGWIKVSVAIVLVAVVIDALLCLPGRQKLLVPAAVAAFAVLYGGLGLVSARGELAQDPQAAVPHSHWVMMGMSGNGGYNNDDYKMTLASAPDKAGRDAFAKAELARRVKELGPGGLAKHWLKKLSVIFGDGTCDIPIYLDMRPVRNTPLQAYAIQGFPHTGRTVYAATALALAGYLLAVAGAVCGVVTRRNEAAFVRIAVLGLCLFLLLWEGQSRYIVNFLPLIVACGALGLAGIWPEKQR